MMLASKSQFGIPSQMHPGLRMIGMFGPVAISNLPNLLYNSALHSGPRGHTEYINGSDGNIYSRDLHQLHHDNPLAGSFLFCKESLNSDFIAHSGQKSGVGQSSTIPRTYCNPVLALNSKPPRLRRVPISHDILYQATSELKQLHFPSLVGFIGS